MEEFEKQRRRDRETRDKELGEHREELRAEREKCAEVEARLRSEMEEIKRDVERKVPELVKGIKREIEEHSRGEIERELEEREKRSRREKDELRREMHEREERFQMKLHDLKRERNEERIELERYRERSSRYEEKIEEMSIVIQDLKEKERLHSLTREDTSRWRGGGPAGGMRGSSYEIKRIGEGKMMKGDELTKATYPVPHNHHMNLKGAAAQGSLGDNPQPDKESQPQVSTETNDQQQQDYYYYSNAGPSEAESNALLSLNQQIADMRQTLNQSLAQTKEKNKQLHQTLNFSQLPTPRHDPGSSFISTAPQAAVAVSEPSRSLSFTSPPRHRPSRSSAGTYSPEQLFLSPKHPKYSKPSQSAQPRDFSSVYEERSLSHSHLSHGAGDEDYRSGFSEMTGSFTGLGNSSRHSQLQQSDSSDSSPSLGSSSSLPTGGYHEGYWKAKYSKLHAR